MLCSSASQFSFLDHSGCRCTNFCAPDCFSDCGAGWGFRHYTEFLVESRAFECHLLWPQATTRCDQMQIIQIWLVVVECCWCLADPLRHVDHCIQDLFIYVQCWSPQNVTRFVHDMHHDIRWLLSQGESWPLLELSLDDLKIFECCVSCPSSNCSPLEDKARCRN